MTDYPKLYFTDISGSNLDVVFGSGLCVKTCPGAEDLQDVRWFLKNCGSAEPERAAETCSVEAARQYASKEFGPICYPDPDVQHPPTVTDHVDKLKEEFEGSKAG